MTAVTQTLFPVSAVLIDKSPEIVQTRVAGHDLVWFSCHGGFDDQEPLQSWLAVQGRSEGDDKKQRYLTLEGVLRHGLTQEVEHVVLAACQVGRTDPNNEHDQMLGYGHAFLLQGVGSVWASAWDAYVGVSAFVWEQAEKERERGIHPALALAYAQRAYRRATLADLRQHWQTWAIPQSPDFIALIKRKDENDQEIMDGWGPFVCFGGGSLCPQI